MKRIMVAVDGSEPSLHAASMAAQLARATGAMLILAHARVPVAYPAEVAWVPSPELEQAQERQAHEILKHTAESLAGPGVQVTALVLHGGAAEAIAEAATREGADLVVVGSRGRGAVARMLLGSVADRLVHICHKPVLVVR